MWRELGGLLLAGLFLELSLRTELANVAAVLAVATVAAVLLRSGRLVQRSARWLVGGALALAPWLMIRASGGLTAVTILAIAALLALATGLSLNGSVTDLKARALLNHLFAQSIEWFHGLEMTHRLLAPAGANRPWVALIRGAAVSLPILLIFGALLTSADRTFAGLLEIDGGWTLFDHIATTTVLAVVLLGLTSRAAHETPPLETGNIKKPLGSIEVHIVLGGVAVLFAAFVTTQVVVAFTGEHLAETGDLTRSAFARRGFFQLLWVAALALALLGVIRSIRPGGSAVRAADESVDELDGGVPGRDHFRPLAVVVLLLTLVMTGISIQRLVQYIDVFGYTPLRLWSLVASVWIGVVIVAYIASISGLSRGRSWFPGFIIISAAVFVFAMNVVNPDAMVARENLTSRTGSQVDTFALASLSDDAIPAAIEHLGQLDDESAGEFIAELCRRGDLESPYGVLGLNFSKRNADGLLEALCSVRNVPDR